MDIQHKMLRSTIEVLINKTIVEIQQDSHRSIRNFVDLGVYFAKGKNQKRFFLRMQKTIQDPKNPFYKLVCDMLENIDIDIVKTLGTNMGCSTFTYGVNTIRKRARELKTYIPPMTVFSWDGALPDDSRSARERAIISDGMELGLYTHVFYVNDDIDRARAIYELAREFPVCSFFILVRPSIITRDFIMMSQGVNNVMISVQAPWDSEELSSAFALLHEARLMYGFHCEYTDDSAASFMADDFVDPLIEAGCFFGGYIYNGDMSGDIPPEMKSYIKHMRTGEGKPILLFDWIDDLKYIIHVITKRGDILRILPDARMGATGNPDGFIDGRDLPLIDVLRATMPEYSEK